jgi:signal transduction histidine kinase
MFYRGTDASTGSGLGLYITTEAVKQLNGSIEVNSEQGKGSNFIVKFPVLNSAKT